jgi:predicted Holliday junction resolvase-like endonuclease
MQQQHSQQMQQQNSQTQHSQQMHMQQQQEQQQQRHMRQTNVTPSAQVMVGRAVEALGWQGQSMQNLSPNDRVSSLPTLTCA